MTDQYQKHLTDYHLALIEGRAKIAREHLDTLAPVPGDGIDKIATIRAVVSYVPALLADIDALSGDVAGLSGSMRAIKDELQQLIEDKRGNFHHLPTIQRLNAIVASIDGALERNGVKYEFADGRKV